jgi:hypothetical protein
MIEPHEMEPDRGRVIVIATLAAITIFLFSQGYYPSKTPFPPPGVTPVDGAIKKRPKLPLLKRINPLRKPEPDSDHPYQEAR